MLTAKQPDHTIGWDVALDRYTAELLADEKSSMTVRNYLRELRVFAAWYHANYGEPPTVADLASAEFRAYKESLRERRLKPATINVAIAAIRSFLKWANSAKLFAEPVRAPKMAKQQARVPKWLTVKQERRLTKVLRKGGDDHHIGLVELMLVFGLRISEISSLTWGDVTIGRAKCELRVYGKGGKERILPFLGNERAKDAFLTMGYKKHGKEKNRRLAQGQRGALSASGIKQLLTPYGKMAEIEPFGAHILRHTCARRMVERTVPIQTIARWLGHENINTTLIYTLPSEDDLAKAAGADSDSEQPWLDDDGA